MADTPIAIQREHTDAGVTLRVEVGAPGTVDETTLHALELAAPGDTRIQVGDGAVVITRFLAAPSPEAEHEGSAALDKTVARVNQALGVINTAAEMGRTVEVAAPRFLPPLPLERVVGRYRTVAKPQPAWAEPDGRQPPIGQLQPGQWYELRGERNDWAWVEGEDLPSSWTDGRTLISLTENDETHGQKGTEA